MRLNEFVILENENREIRVLKNPNVKEIEAMYNNSIQKNIKFPEVMMIKIDIKNEDVYVFPGSYSNRDISKAGNYGFIFNPDGNIIHAVGSFSREKKTLLINKRYLKRFFIDANPTWLNKYGITWDEKASIGRNKDWVDKALGTKYKDIDDKIAKRKEQSKNYKLKKNYMDGLIKNKKIIEEIIRDLEKSAYYVYAKRDSTSNLSRNKAELRKIKLEIESVKNMLKKEGE